MNMLLPRISYAVRNSLRFRTEGSLVETVNSCTDCDLLVAEMNALAAIGCELMERSEPDPVTMFAFRH